MYSCRPREMVFDRVYGSGESVDRLTLYIECVAFATHLRSNNGYDKQRPNTKTQILGSLRSGCFYPIMGFHSLLLLMQ